jgi:YegS/Rv2252/BmrU family lipid kinase
MESGKKNVQFIINPFAGRSTKDKLPELIKSSLDPNEFEYDIRFTQFSGHASELTKKALLENVDAVVAVGGDGTLNEIASELKNSKTPLGIIPGGSGNGLSMHLGIGRNATKALKIFANFRTKMMDTAMVNDRFYLNMAGVGIDGLIAYKTKLNHKRGFTNYVKGAIVEGLKYKNQIYKVAIEDKEYEGKFLSINVANGSMFGYNFTIAADADTTDGLMNTLMIHDANKINYVGNAWRFWAKRIHKSKLASTGKSTNIKLIIYEDSYMHVDGEGFPCKAGEFLFSVAPKSLKVIY